MLANVYMNRFLKYWRQSGRNAAYQAHVVSYADDFVILSRDHAEEADVDGAGDEPAGADPQRGEDLGPECSAREVRLSWVYVGPHHFPRNGRWYLGASPSKKSVQRIKDKVGEIMVPGNHAPWAEVCDQLNGLLRGWRSYFDYGSHQRACEAVDHHVFRSVRRFLVRRHKVPTRGTRRFTYTAVYGVSGCFG